MIGMEVVFFELAVLIDAARHLRDESLHIKSLQLLEATDSYLFAGVPYGHTRLFAR